MRETRGRPLATPRALREGVRDAILRSLAHDRERDDASVVRKLVAAAAAGIAMALALVILFGEHADEHLHPWRLAVCAATWSVLLVQCFALVFLGLRTRRMPDARAAALGLVGVALAAVVGRLCPEPSYLNGWNATALGARSLATGGSAGSALCFGLFSGALLGAVASLPGALWDAEPRRPVISALVLTALLLPAILLQTLEVSLAAFASWGLGTAAGAYLGIAATAAAWAHRRVSS
jgi:hypothetical protein